MDFNQTASAFTRRRILKGAATMAVASLLDGCATNQPAASSATPYTQPIPTGALSTATLSVSTQAAGVIGSNFIGLSDQKFAMTQKLFGTASSLNANLLALTQRLGPGVLRIGGIPADQCVWNQTGTTGGVSEQIAPPDVDNLAAFVKAAGWQCLYAINLKGYPPSGVSLATGTPATTPALAAAEVAYVVKALGSSLIGIEIGNEPDNYGWTYAQFQAQWAAMRNAIVAVTPTAPMTGPATGNNTSTWTVPFGKWATSSQISMLTQHYYIACGCNGTTYATDLVDYPDTNLINSYLLPMQAAAPGLGIPFRMAEANSYYTDTGTYGLQDSYASALWMIDFLFTCAQYGAAGVNIHGGGDGPTFTPIADNNAATLPTVLGPRPEYYALEFFSLVGTGAMNSTTLSTGSMNVSAFAVKTASGGTNIVINNKTASNIQMAISLPQGIKSAFLLELTQFLTGQTAPVLSAAPVSDYTGDQSAGMTMQGLEINANGTFENGTVSTSPPYVPYTLSPSGNQVTCYVPALSAVLVQTT